MDVAFGLEYLHGLDFIHGDIKPTNILVDGDGRAVVSDIDRSIVVDERGFTMSSGVASVRYASPEVLGVGEPTFGEDLPILVAKPMDVYSFAMSILEILTGLPPFHPCKYSTAVVFAIGERRRPLRHSYPAIHDNMWDLLESGWAHSPESRPEIGPVVKRLKDAIGAQVDFSRSAF